jgi:contact-dependent growth inhibition (CDI) system CdiI-like immunity protein
MRKGPRPDMRPMREKSLEELEGFAAGDPPYDSYLVRTIYALRKKPIGEFTAEDLRITIGQSRGIPYLLPLALERLEQDPLAEGHMYRGDLLMSVVGAEPHWGGSPEVRARVRRLVERALERLSRVEPVDWAAGELPDADQPDEIDREQLEPRLREALAQLG